LNPVNVYFIDLFLTHSSIFARRIGTDEEIQKTSNQLQIQAEQLLICILVRYVFEPGEHLFHRPISNTFVYFCTSHRHRRRDTNRSDAIQKTSNQLQIQAEQLLICILVRYVFEPGERLFHRPITNTFVYFCTSHRHRRRDTNRTVAIQKKKKKAINFKFRQSNR
jgi:hypothetical protein